MMLKLMEFLYLDGYTSLKAKYADPYREEFREERHWVAENYKDYINAAIHFHDYETALAMRRAKKENDYLLLYVIMKEYNGEPIEAM